MLVLFTEYQILSFTECWIKLSYQNIPYVLIIRTMYVLLHVLLLCDTGYIYPYCSELSLWFSQQNDCPVFYKAREVLWHHQTKQSTKWCAYFFWYILQTRSHHLLRYMSYVLHGNFACIPNLIFALFARCICIWNVFACLTETTVIVPFTASAWLTIIAMRLSGFIPSV